MDLLKACKKEKDIEPWWMSILTGIVFVITCFMVCALIYVIG